MVLRVVDLGSLLFWVNKRTRCQLGWLTWVRQERTCSGQLWLDRRLILSVILMPTTKCQINPFYRNWSLSISSWQLSVKKFTSKIPTDFHYWPTSKHHLFCSRVHGLYIYMLIHYHKKKKCTVKGYIVYNATIHIDVIKNMIIVAF
jgi:hypothetical protein